MANCIAYCGNTLPDHSTVACEEYFKGGISAYVIFDCGSEPEDPTNGEAIQELINQGKAKLVAGVKIELPEGSEVTVDNPVGCGFPSITLTADRVANLTDGNVTAENVDFYNALIGKKAGAILMYECDADRVTFISPKGGIIFFGNRIAPPTNGELQTFTGQFRWREKTIAKIYDAPAGIFD
jgi:hypothetical protein